MAIEMIEMSAFKGKVSSGSWRTGSGVIFVIFLIPGPNFGALIALLVVSGLHYATR